tara:strand:+ start:6135 stop:7775 length:1641 start_codon:yes stop_codon:yes gene_type:complete
MDYFSIPFNISLLRNHILKDPIVDWFNIQESLNCNKYERDNNTFYKDFILKEWCEYKDKFFESLKQKANTDIPMNTSVEETEKMIKEKEPLILGAHLQYKEMVIYCDIIIEINLFISIFPKIKNYPLHLIKNKYILINLSYSTLNLKNDLSECLNEGVLPYKKCVLYGFSKCIERLEGYKPHTFIIGKEYYYKKTQLSKNEFISFVKHDTTIINKFTDAYQWITLLRKDFKNIKIEDKPTHKELYPNMNNKESDWEKEKLKLANEIKEITLVWNITYDERCSLHEKNIYCWDDPKLLPELKESKKKNIQEQMIHMNKTNDILIYPRKNVSNPLREVLKEEEKNNIFFDVESFLTIDEKVDFFNKKDEKYNNPILAILGFFYKGSFYDFTIQKYDIKDEKIIVKKFSDKLWSIYKDYGRINIFHWGHAECKYMEYIHEIYGDIDFPDYILVDLLDHFRLEPIIVQGVFQFGLKSIGKALYNNGLIETTWDESNDNGLDAMIKFKEICKNPKKIPLKRYLEIKDIIYYNQIDCKVLQDIYFLLKKNYY